MAFNNIQNIRLNLLIPFIGSLFIIIVSGVWGLHLHHESDQEAFTKDINHQLENGFNQAISDDISLIESLLFFITHKTELQQSWTKKDRKKLFKNSLPIFETIKKQHNITHFYFHDIKGKNFLRVHLPKHNGDTITRPTLARAIKTQTISSGIEFGTFGQFVLRVVIPWEINGILVGYVELGEEINHILETLSKNNHYELLLTLEKNYIENNNLEKTDFFINHKKMLDQKKSIFVLHKTIHEIPRKLSNIIDEKHYSLGSRFSYHDKTYMVSKIDIINSNNNPIAALHYVLDISQKTAHDSSLLKVLGGTISIVSLILIAFYSQYSGKLQVLVNTNIKALRNEIIDRKQAQQETTRNQATLEDIIQERNTSLEESRKRYQTLFDKTADALLIIEGNAFIDCNQAALDMLHYESKEDLCNTHPSILSPEYQPDGQLSEIKADHMIETAFEKGSHRFEWDHMRKNGDIFPVEVLLTSIPFENTPLLHVVWRDITERKKAEAAIEHQAYYDHLTELPNRKLLLDRLKQALITSRAHNYFGALLFIDLDRFKSINDSLGHSAGDKLLIEASQRIKSCIYEEDTASRFGGDEYLVLLKHLGDHKEPASLTAKKISSRIQDVFRKPFFIDDQELHITTSIGIALFPLKNESVEDIIKHADTAMYNAKENGRNQISFYLSKMHEKVIQRLTLEKDLRNAVKANNLDLYYQPQINRQGDIIAVEALLRWQHPTQGFINPEVFIGIAEDTGLIYEIGEFVLHKSISDISSINNQFSNQDNEKIHTPLQLSINISPHQFRKPNFVDIIRTVKDDYQLEKQLLTLELTESIAIDNLDEAVKKFNELRSFGVRLSLDDFGTGFSSLSHLKRLPLDELKIDKSFVFDIEDDPKDALLIKTIIKIAHQFDLEVVAEGVETKEQLAFLQAEHCNIYQGYYYSKPVPLEQLIRLIQRHI